MKLITVFLASLMLFAQTPDTELSIRLTTPLNTKFNRVSDIVAAKVLAPAMYAGGYLEGEVRELHDGKKGADITFAFQTLHSGGKDIPVSIVVTGIANSKQQANADDSGSEIHAERQGGGAIGKFGQLAHLGRGSGSSRKAGEATKISSKGETLLLSAGSGLTVQCSFGGTK
jgi:hypothetical protein